MGKKKNYKWSAEDNLVGETELQLSTILTEELTKRPAVSLRTLFASLPVQEKTLPLLVDLEKKTNKALKAETKEVRDGNLRKVFVEIVPRNSE